MVQIKEDSFLIYPFEALEGMDQCQIIVILEKRKLVISGQKLSIDYFSSTEIIGRGEVEAVQFFKK